MRSCETCLNLYRDNRFYRVKRGFEMEIRRKRCAVREIEVDYPVDDCSDYERWVELKREEEWKVKE